MSGRQDWVWALPILEEHGEIGLGFCVFGCGGVGDVGGEWVGVLGQSLGGGVMSVCRCQVQVSVYCDRRIH